MSELEFEFRVYRTPEKGKKRECIVARNVPHALQVWDESIDAFSRSLELVISGGWLMELLNQRDADGEGGKIPDDLCENQREVIMGLCVEGLVTEDCAKKQQSLERILAVLGCDLDAIKVEHGLE